MARRRFFSSRGDPAVLLWPLSDIHQLGRRFDNEAVRRSRKLQGGSCRHRILAVAWTHLHLLRHRRHPHQHRRLSAGLPRDQRHQGPELLPCGLLHSEPHRRHRSGLRVEVRLQPRIRGHRRSGDANRPRIAALHAKRRNVLLDPRFGLAVRRLHDADLRGRLHER